MSVTLIKNLSTNNPSWTNRFEKNYPDPIKYQVDCSRLGEKV
jgi:hypothetical protein